MKTTIVPNKKSDNFNLLRVFMPLQLSNDKKKIVVLLTLVVMLSGGWRDFHATLANQSAQGASAVPAFDGKKAFGYLSKQIQCGPRAPGSAGHERCLNLLRAELKRSADNVQLQQFAYGIPGEKKILLTNIIASCNTKAKTQVLLSAHWDTRLWADQDPNPENRKKPIPGANDGASGVAILLEVARQIKRQPPPCGVTIVLFDGEDLGTSGHPESFSVGARYFAKNMPPGFSPKFGINIDMVGDRQLRILREVNSDRYAPSVMNLVFRTAHQLGIAQFVDEVGSEITDDHLPLNAAGVQTIDLIDFSYPDDSNKYWHTLADTPDKCSAESLAAVGRVLLTIVYSNASTIE